jgi:flagellar biosynthesis protein FlhF
MKIKSFFADSVEDAINKARQELGPEAMILNSRKSSPEARMLGDYEVVFAADVPEAQARELASQDYYPAATAGAPPRRAAAAAAGAGRITDSGLMEDIADLRKQMSVLRRGYAFGAPAPGLAAAHGDWTDIYSSLISNEFCAELASEICSDLISRAADNPALARKPARTVLSEELESLVEVASDLGSSQRDERKVVAVVGPPGAGKTTTLVKLAILYGLKSRRPMQFISMDTYRVGALEELRLYSSILGVGMQAVETPATLAQSLEEYRSKGMVLIDTPGFGPNDFDLASDLALYFTRNQEIDVHLVLPAQMRATDMARTAERFNVFGYSKLIFTNLDQTATYGPILTQAIRSRKPISFLTNGQQVPEDIEPATKARMIDLLLHRGAASRAA